MTSIHERQIEDAVAALHEKVEKADAARLAAATAPLLAECESWRMRAEKAERALKAAMHIPDEQKERLAKHALRYRKDAWRWREDRHAQRRCHHDKIIECERLREAAADDPEVIQKVASRIHNLDLFDLEAKLKVAEEALSLLAFDNQYTVADAERWAREAIAKISGRPAEATP